MTASLSGLTIGSLTLSPEFNSDTISYTAATTNATNMINATPTDLKSTVTIKNGETEIANGTAATWVDGENTVTIAVKNGDKTKTYTVVVTKGT